MSERGEALLDALYYNVHTGQGREVALAICEHLGLTWEMLSDFDHITCGGNRHDDGCAGCLMGAVADAIATLLEAAGVER